MGKLMLNLSPIDMLKGWGQKLTSPVGLILLGIVIIYIFLVVTGKIQGFGLADKIGGGKKGGGSSGGSQRPDYIIK